MDESRIGSDLQQVDDRVGDDVDGSKNEGHAGDRGEVRDGDAVGQVISDTGPAEHLFDDDDTGEHMAWMTEKLMEKGALDVWQTPATGKKGRVLVSLSVLVVENSWAEFADWILRNSTTFGVRYRKWDRLKLARKFEMRETANGPVKHKIGLTTNDDILKEKAEYEDLVK